MEIGGTTGPLFQQCPLHEKSEWHFSHHRVSNVSLTSKLNFIKSLASWLSRVRTWELCESCIMAIICSFWELWKFRIITGDEDQASVYPDIRECHKRICRNIDPTCFMEPLPSPLREKPWGDFQCNFSLETIPHKSPVFLGDGFHYLCTGGSWIGRSHLDAGLERTSCNGFISTQYLFHKSLRIDRLFYKMMNTF